MRRQLVAAVPAFVIFTVVAGLVYPLAVTGIAQVLFPGKADGSLIQHDGRVIGSRLVGQAFASERYFRPRPSAAGDDGYDASSSSASNLGPTNEELLAAVRKRVAEYRKANGLPGGTRVPVEAVTASGSGLDPHIVPADARRQAPRVARARGMPLGEVLRLVDEHTNDRSLGFLGENGVNVLELNLALDGAG